MLPEPGQERLGGAACELRPQSGNQDLAVLGARRIGAKPFIAPEIRAPEHLAAQAAVLLVVSDRERDAAVRGVEQLVWYDAGMRIAETGRIVSGVEITGGDVSQEMQSAVVERDIDHCPMPVRSRA
jgi:hypothetical protein